MAASKRRDAEEPNGERCPSCEELAAENQALKERLAEVERAVEC